MTATDDLKSLARKLIVLSTIPTLALGLFLFARLVAGKLANPLPEFELLSTAVLLTIWAAFVILLSPRAISGSLRIAPPVIALLLFAIACSYPATRPIDWLIWPFAILTVIAIAQIDPHSLSWLIETNAPDAAPNPVAIHPDDIQHFENKYVETMSAQVEEPITSELDESQQVLQQLTRTRDHTGHESIHGTLTAEFAVGDRQCTLFVSFCPPFERLPHVEAEISDGASADVKVSQVLHIGAQLEVRLSTLATVGTVVSVEFFASDASPESG